MTGLSHLRVSTGLSSLFSRMASARRWRSLMVEKKPPSL